MNKETKGRTPKLEGLVEEATSIFAKFHGKEIEATVYKSGVVKFDGEEYTSPSKAGSVAAGGMSVNGWTFWRVKVDGQLLPLDVLRGDKVKAMREPKAKAAPKAKKPKAAKKPRKPKKLATPAVNEAEAAA